MADVESLFEFVHMEIVAYFQNKPGKHIDNDVIQNLEHLGFSVGQRLVERFTKDSPRFKDELEIMKYICKDFWTAVYKKQIDNLRTNHQGTYVLQDNNFQLLTQMSDGKQYTEDAPKFLAFPVGLIRGALSNLGLTCSVSADVLSMPKCTYMVNSKLSFPAHDTYLQLLDVAVLKSDEDQGGRCILRTFNSALGVCIFDMESRP